MADFTGVTESECVQRKRPEGCAENDSHTFVLQSVINEIKVHGRSSPHEEVCGILLGNLCFDGYPYLLIDGRIEGKYATHQSGSVTFTSETWDYINSERDAKFADRRIVGWYHTHPGFGIFLSNMDAFIHNNFFSLKWQPAYVFDPQAETDGFFFAMGNALERDNVAVVPDVPPLVAVPQTATSSEKIVLLTEEEENRRAEHRFTTLILAATLFFILLVGGLCAFIARDKFASSRKNIAEKAKKVQDLEAENGRLMSEKRELGEKINEIMAQLGETEEKLRLAKEYNLILISSNETLVAKLDLAITEGSRYCNKVAEGQRKVESLENELQKTQKNVLEKDIVVKEYVKKISQIETHARELEFEIAALRQELVDASASAKANEGDMKQESGSKRPWYKFW